MSLIASQITSLTIVYTTVYSDVHQRKHQSSASLAFVRGIHRGPVNSPHKGPVTRKIFPFDDVIMISTNMNNRPLTLQRGFSVNKIMAHKVILRLVAVNTSAIRNKNKQKQQYIVPMRNAEIRVLRWGNVYRKWEIISYFLNDNIISLNSDRWHMWYMVYHLWSGHLMTRFNTTRCR